MVHQKVYLTQRYGKKMPLADTEPEENPVLWRTCEPRHEVGCSPAHTLTNDTAPAGRGPCTCSPKSYRTY